MTYAPFTNVLHNSGSFLLSLSAATSAGCAQFSTVNGDRMIPVVHTVIFLFTAHYICAFVNWKRLTAEVFRLFFPDCAFIVTVTFVLRLSFDVFKMH